MHRKVRLLLLTLIVNSLIVPALGEASPQFQFAISEALRNSDGRPTPGSVDVTLIDGRLNRTSKSNLVSTKTDISPQARAGTLDQYPLRLLDYNFQQMPIASVVQKIVETECITVLFDHSVEDFVNTKMDLRLMKSSPMRALWVVLESQHLNYDYTADRTLIVFRGKAPEKVKVMDMVYRSVRLVAAIEQISQLAGLTARLHNSAQMYQAAQLNITLKDISLLRGLEWILNSRRLTYEHIDCSTIIIFPDESIWLA
jgi:hypothetical protein